MTEPPGSPPPRPGAQPPAGPPSPPPWQGDPSGPAGPAPPPGPWHGPPPVSGAPGPPPWYGPPEPVSVPPAVPPAQQWSPAPAGPSPWPGRIATGYVGLAGLVAAMIVVLSQTITWMVEQLALIQGSGGLSWVPTSLAYALAVLVFVAPILFFPRRWPALRATGLAWLAATGLLAALGMLRTIPVVLNEHYLAGLALFSWVVAGGAALVRRLRRTPGPDPDDAAPDDRPPGGPDPDGAAPDDRPPGGPAPGGAAVRSRAAGWLGAAAGLTMLLPWLWLGALGGLIETVLAALAASGFGALSATVLGTGFWTPLVRLDRWKLVLGGGYTAGVGLTLLAGSFGGSGIQLAGLLSLPALGYAAAALHRQDTRLTRLPVGVLVAVAAFGPLGFADPEEISLLLELEALWVLLAAAIALGIALLDGIGLWVLPRPAALRTGLAALLTLVVALAGFGVYAAAGQSGFHGERVFVVMKSQASLANIDTGGSRTERIAAVYQRLVDHAERTQRGLRGALDDYRLDYTPYYLVNGVSVRAGPALRDWLSTRDDVDRVLLDPVLRPIPGDPSTVVTTFDPEPTAPRWNLKMVGAPEAWQEFDATGEGIVVGVSDSGVDGRHPALKDGFRGGGDSWYDPWNHTRAPTDPGGHGTHTTGTAVGTHHIGVAPGAKWVGCVNLARNMAGPSRYLDCLQFMLAPFRPGEDPFTDGDPARAPHVLNNSWGCPELEGCDARSLRPAIEAFRAAGIFFVASAGNSGPDCGSLTDPPARYGSAFSVAAVNQDHRVTDFSSRGRHDGGPQPDIAAPGAKVLSALPGGRYAKLDGTSMAGPHVAGVVALLWSAVPSLVGDIDRTERLLRTTAEPVRDVGPCGMRAVAGSGIVDAHAAIRGARSGTE